MNPLTYITERQYSWARRQGVNVDEAGYVEVLNDNLFLPLIAEAIQEYQAGAGHELDQNMLAVHSSSALVANVFNYWRLYSNFPTILSSVCPDLQFDHVQGIHFEVPCPIGWPPPGPPFSPHLDVVITYQTDASPGVTKAIAIESKFGEIYGHQAQNQFAPAYFEARNAGIWNGLGALRVLAEQLQQQGVVFQQLGVAQLIKHILGLNSTFGGTANFVLVYLWYPVFGQEACVHLEEIELFQQILNACTPPVKFRALEYHELIRSLAHAHGDQHGAYVDYLTERYF